MNETPPEWQNENEKVDADLERGFGPLLWFLLGVLPIPIGLLMGPASLFNNSLGGQSSAPVILVLLSLPCVVLSGIGLCGGFRSRRFGAIVGGMAVGLLIGVFDAGVIFFAGCCSSMGFFK